MAWGYARLNPRSGPGETQAEETKRFQASTASTPVTVHVYSVTVLPSIQRVNSVLGKLGTGAYHAGVEIYGREWSFGATDDGGSGVFCCRPGECQDHAHIKVLPMGHAPMSEEEAYVLLERLSREWQGEDYDLLRCNCCHFADELCRQLGVGPLPRWVTNLAGVGAAIDDAADRAREKLQDRRGSGEVTTSPGGFRWSRSGSAGGDERRGRSRMTTSPAAMAACLARAMRSTRQRAQGALACGSEFAQSLSFRSRSYGKCV